MSQVNYMLYTFFNNYFINLSAFDFFADDCGWCKRPVSLDSPDFLVTPEGTRYCTESCFAQCRRASFKRAKTCDWCKHIRHAVSYVDFQDGASQLQFCSDKCLNQYKMQIFCKETQAHLDMNPHLRENNNPSSNNNLITPELWMKNCRSRSTSPNSDRSKHSLSPIPKSQSQSSSIPSKYDFGKSRVFENAAAGHANYSESPSGYNYRPTTTTVSNDERHQASVQQKPMLSVTSPSKLMPSLTTRNNVSLRYQQSVNVNTMVQSKYLRRKRSLRMPISNGVINNNTHKNNNNINDSCNVNSSHLNNQNVTKDIRLEIGRDPDAQVNAAGIPKTNNQPLPHPLGNFNFLLPSHNLFNSRPSLNDGVSGPRFMQPFLGSPLLQQPPPPLPPPPPSPQLPPIAGHPTSMPDANIPRLPLFGATQPPVTILVPYPIVLPFPVPILIPMPFDALLKAAELKLKYDNLNKAKSETNVNGSKTTEIDAQFSDNDNNSKNSLSIDQPLDFTKTKDIETAREPIVTAATKRTPSIVNIMPYDSNESDIEEIQAHNENTMTDINNDEQPIIDNNRPEINQNTQSDVHFSNQKLNRLHTKRIIAKESESSRPLRKRKRIIDCDYLRDVNRHDY